jgi:hypothetical protein
MESHPLTKLVVAAVGLGLFAVAIWFGRTDGGTTDEDSDYQLPADMPADAGEKDVGKRPFISSKGPYPKVKLDEEQYNFSVMAVGSDGSHSFVVRNLGDVPLILVKGPTTCKCTISELEAGAIPVGGSATIDLTWKAESFNPMFNQIATIWTNDPKKDEFDLTISGNITTKIMVKPQGAWALNEISEKTRATVTGTVFSLVLDSFEIDEAQLSSDALDVKVEPMSPDQLKTLKAKSGYQVNVSVTPDVPVGRFREKLTIKLKKQDIDPIEIFVEGRRTGPITFLSARKTRWNPNGMSINLGQFDAKLGASGALLLSVRGLADEDFKITSVVCDPDDLQIELKRDKNFREGAPKKLYELQFKLPPGRRPETRSVSRPAVVEIKTNHPEAETLKFRLIYICR